jgi:hypothetical protein
VTSSNRTFIWVFERKAENIWVFEKVENMELVWTFEEVPGFEGA